MPNDYPDTWDDEITDTDVCTSQYALVCSNSISTASIVCPATALEELIAGSLDIVESNDWTYGVFRFVQRLRAIYPLHTPDSVIEDAVARWYVAVDEANGAWDVDDCEVIQCALERWPTVQFPAFSAPEVVNAFLVDAASDPPVLAYSIAKQLYRGSPLMTSMIAMCLCLHERRQGSTWFLPTIKAALILGWEPSAHTRAARLLRALKKDGVITEVEPVDKRRRKSPHYIWSWKG